MLSHGPSPTGPKPGTHLLYSQDSPKPPPGASSVPAVGAHVNPGLIPAGSTSTAALAAGTAAPAAGHRAGQAEAGPRSAPCTAGPANDLLPEAPWNNQSIPGIAQQLGTEREKGTACSTVFPGSAVLAVSAARSEEKGKRNKEIHSCCTKGPYLQRHLMELGVHLPSNSIRAFLVSNYTTRLSRWPLPP